MLFVCLFDLIHRFSGVPEYIIVELRPDLTNI